MVCLRRCGPLRLRHRRRRSTVAVARSSVDARTHRVNVSRCTVGPSSSTAYKAAGPLRQRHGSSPPALQGGKELCSYALAPAGGSLMTMCPSALAPASEEGAEGQLEGRWRHVRGRGRALGGGGDHATRPVRVRTDAAERPRAVGWGQQASGAGAGRPGQSSPVLPRTSHRCACGVVRVWRRLGGALAPSDSECWRWAGRDGGTWRLGGGSEPRGRLTMAGRSCGMGRAPTAGA